MKRTIITFPSIILLFAMVIVWAQEENPKKATFTDLNMTLKVTPEKQTFVLGEVVKLDFELVNESNQTLKIPVMPDVKTGYLKVFIATSEQDFKQYHHSGWGLEESGGRIIQAGQSLKSQATLLWNVKPKVAHLNSDSAERVSKGRILTDYVFPKAGVYFVKAVLTLPNNTPTKIESAPIQIVVNEPIGDDLKIWNQIKDNGEIAYFVQQGEILNYQSESSEKQLNEIKQIIENYPNSYLAKQMKRKLEMFRADEEKRKEMLEKAKMKHKN